MKPKIEIRKDGYVSSEYYLRVRAANGEILMHSEIYASKSNAKRAAKRLQSTVAKAVIVEVE